MIMGATGAACEEGRQMRFRAILLSLTLIVTFPVAASSAPSIAATAGQQELCFGQVPTIVGKPGYAEVVGTQGPDVVVTNGALAVSTLGGDDLLCVTGVYARDEYWAMLSTGRGKDRIDATGGQFPDPSGQGFRELAIFPGSGRDEVLGGPPTTSTGESLVVLGVYADDETGSHKDADIIRTGDGHDFVSAGPDDMVDLGPGNDSLRFTSKQGGVSSAVFDGGEGRNTIMLSLWGSLRDVNEHHSWKINNRAGRLLRDGEGIAQVTGFSDFDVQVLGPLRFVGSDLPEAFYSSLALPDEPYKLWRFPRHWPLLLDMGGGDDFVGYNRGGPDSRFDGGAGTDRFAFVVDPRLCECRNKPDRGFLNLSTGTLRYSHPDKPEVRTHVVNFENVLWIRTAGTIRGTDGPNEILIRYPRQDKDMIMYGMGGDDTLRSSLGNDVLIGGQGHDIADGGDGGFDRCKAEVRRHCES